MKRKLQILWDKIVLIYFKLTMKNKPQAPVPMDAQLVNFLQATWAQKQLDDLLLMNAQISQQLKGDPYNMRFLNMRDKVQHDISKLQPIVLELGITCAGILESKFNVSFTFLSGRNKPVPPKETPPMVVNSKGDLPVQEKK